MRLYLLGTSRDVHGPYDWKFVRELFAFGLIEGCLICEVGKQQWEPIAENALDIPENGLIAREAVRRDLDFD